MPRLAVVDPTHSQGKAKEIFEGPLKGKHFNIFKAMANSPAALNVYVSIEGALHHGMLTAKEREVIALAVGELNDCGYCLSAHTALGKMAGLTEPQTLAARGKGPIDDAKLEALAKFTRQIHEKKGALSDGEIAAFRKAGYSDGHIAEVCAAYALNVYTNVFNAVNDTPSEFPPAPKL
jgi:uncharacterized peroxidase-related enzyme